ncbi:MAG: hypothetical protein ACLFV7_06970, partial [Phycisphaerae bacterium]
MPRPLTSRHVLESLRDAFRQQLLLQQTDPADPQFGGIVNLDSSLATARRTGHLLSAALYLLTDDPDCLDESTMRRLRQAADYLQGVLRPTGRFDEPDCNIDSGPATAFILQELLPAMTAARDAAPRPCGDLLAGLDSLAGRAMTGLHDGGFHTPNHRWVWASALAQAADWLGTAPPAVLEDILAEGIDIDDDGAFLERSIESYDGVTNLSLLLLHRHTRWDAALPAVRKNLHMDTHLLHADGTVDTCLSRRWGGVGRAPLPLAAAALAAAGETGEGAFAAMGRSLWSASPAGDLRGLVWLAWARHHYPDALDMPGELPTDFTRPFPANGLWRHRKDDVSVSVLASSRNLLTMRNGGAQLARTTIRFSYFGAAGDFVGSFGRAEPAGAELHFDGRRMPRRPAYEMPLGEPVDPAEWGAALQRRSQRAVEPQEATLSVTPQDSGVRLRLQNLGGLAGTPAQIAFDFVPGGRWESTCDLFHPSAGGSIVLRGGWGQMRYGAHAIRIAPQWNPAEAPCHTWGEMRDS